MISGDLVTPVECSPRLNLTEVPPRRASDGLPENEGFSETRKDNNGVGEALIANRAPTAIPLNQGSLAGEHRHMPSLRPDQ